MKSTSKSSKKNDRANVVLFPPLVGLFLVLLGIGLHVAYPIYLIPGGWIVFFVGLIVLLLGVGLQILCLRTLKKAKTTPLFKNPTKSVVRSGPYSRSRNPIYIAVLLQFLGVALIANTLWLVIIIPVLFLYLHFGVVLREEKYLENKFGKDYLKYKSSVPQWI